MRLYLIRHGKTALGARLRFQTPETGVSAAGAQDVRACANELRGVHVDALYTSPYRRARESADIIAHTIGGLVPRVKDIFREKYNGRNLDTRGYLSFAAFRLGADTIRHVLNPNYRGRDEETLDDLYDRADACRAFLQHHAADHETVVVVAHSLLISAFIERVHQRYTVAHEGRLSRLWRFGRIVLRALCMRSAALYICTYTERGWSVESER